MMLARGSRRGVVSKETALLCIAGLLMTAFQVRFVQDNNIVKAFSILSSGAVVFLSTLLLNGERRSGGTSRFLLAYFLVFVMSYAVELFYAKTSDAMIKVVGNTIFLSLAFFQSFLIFSRQKYSTPHFFIRLLFVNISFYVSINLFFYIIGLRRSWSDQFLVDYDSGSAVMLASIGVTVDRVVFLLSNGINSYAPVVGMLLGLSFIFLKKGIVFVGLLTVALVSCLLIDSRSSIFYPLLALVISFWVDRGRRWKSGLVVASLLPVLPFVNELLFFIIGSILGDQSFLSRSESDAGSLNGRYIIWIAIFNVFSNFELAQIVGYGNAGQVASGATAAISATQEFSNYLSPEGIGAHNTYLQVLLNSGYLGLLFYIALFVVLFKRIALLIECGVVVGRYRLAILFIYFEIMLFNNTEVGVIPPGQMFLPVVMFSAFLLLASRLDVRRV